MYGVRTRQHALTAQRRTENGRLATGTVDEQFPTPSISILTMSARQLIHKSLSRSIHKVHAQNPIIFHSQDTLPAGRNTVQTARVTHECMYIAVVVVTKRRQSVLAELRARAASLPEVNPPRRRRPWPAWLGRPTTCRGGAPSRRCPSPRGCARGAWPGWAPWGRS
jgi:hypothetical protein